MSSPVTIESKDISTNQGVTTPVLEEIPRITRCQNIVIITSELKKNQKSQNVINNALALLLQGHRVRIVVSYLDEDLWEDQMNKLSIKVMRSWLPSSLFGFFKNELRIIRTISLAFWCSTYSAGKNNPTIIFTDTCAISMPILKMFGYFKIIYFQYFFQLEHLPSQRHLLSITPTLIQNWSMKYADEVIVQNYACARIFTNAFKNIIIPRVLYPCVDIGAMECEECINMTKIVKDFQTENNLFFLITGPYLPRSNFELAIESFDILYSKLYRKGQKRLPLLVIAGKYSDIDITQRAYYTKLLEHAANLLSSNNIVMLKKFSTITKKTLLTYCLAVLQTTPNEIFGNQILEAMYMGKPVIACNDGVGTEYLTVDCGILAKPNSTSFSSAMYSLLRDRVMCEVLGLEAKKYFNANFGFMKYSSILSGYVEHLAPKKARNLSYVECVSEISCDAIKTWSKSCG